ncbi:hypothetical protein [Blastococcus sp. SYSU DS0828]
MALLEGLAALAAKFAGASTVAQVATGVGIATAGVTGAGAVGVLPAPVQDAVASTVETVTPFDLPESELSTETETETDAPVGDTEGDPVTTEDEATDDEVVEEEATEDEATEDEATENEVVEEEAAEDEATEEQTGARGLDNAIAHANEHAQGALQAAQARQAAHDAEKAARDAARDAEKAARDAAKAARAATAPVEETVAEPEETAGAATGKPADQGPKNQGRGGN